MKVYGYEISRKAIDEAIEDMKMFKRFKAKDVERTLIICGVTGDGGIAYRAADRIIQQQRKAGNIIYSSENRSWQWIGGGKDA